jgi:hypothetical protein
MEGGRLGGRRVVRADAVSPGGARAAVESVSGAG